MKSKKGISLIVLVITIIVMIILASAVIITLSNTNIINKAKDAVEKNNTSNNKYLSEIKLAERKIEKVQGASQVKDAQGGVLRVENKDTDNEIYYIESIDDLVAFSESVNGGNTYEGKTVVLTQLLDFNSDKSYVDVSLKETVTTGNGFTPIGTYDNPFKGTFDGDGTEIRNLYINNEELELVGFFGKIEDAAVKNLGLTGNVKGTVFVGGMIASAQAVNKHTYIQNCYTDVDISESQFTSADIYMAGFVTDLFGKSEENKIYLHDCYNQGKVTFSLENDAITAYVGGISVSANFTEINRCYNKGDIYVEKDAVSVAGILANINNTKIYNTYNIGNITTISATTVAGIVAEASIGRDYATYAKIYNVYNAGNITCSLGFVENAGIIGCMNIEEFAINTATINLGNAFNAGKMQSTDGTTLKELIGSIKNVNIDKNLYYIEGRNIPAASENVNTEKFVPKTLSQMNSQAFVDELNENIKDMPECVKWKLGENGYPVLDM